MLFGSGPFDIAEIGIELAIQDLRIVMKNRHVELTPREFLGVSEDRSCGCGMPRGSVLAAGIEFTNGDQSKPKILAEARSGLACRQITVHAVAIEDTRLDEGFHSIACSSFTRRRDLGV